MQFDSLTNTLMVWRSFPSSYLIDPVDDLFPNLTSKENFKMEKKIDYKALFPAQFCLTHPQLD